MAETNWFVCQIGAREHYSVARALHQCARLQALLTDVWTPPGALLSRASKRLGQRYHGSLSNAKVRSATSRAMTHTLQDLATGRSGWSSIMDRNEWFSKWAAKEMVKHHGSSDAANTTVFAYSYAARHIFRQAKQAGFRTVLGQIDPGPVEASLVSDLYAQAGQSDLLETIPETYWDTWREEVELADIIAVNSEWSAQCLTETGVPRDKIRIIPLALSHDVPQPNRKDRPAISASNPLKLLFLGQVTLRKGIHLVFEAARLLPQAPIQIDIVGDLQVAPPDWVEKDHRIRFHRRVDRNAVWDHYKAADMFLFPTYSDGFGLTQLEALAAGVPVIASKRCGEVVAHEVNGYRMEELSAASLAAAIENVLHNSDQLLEWTANAVLEPRFEISALAETLQNF